MSSIKTQLTSSSDKKSIKIMGFHSITKIDRVFGSNCPSLVSWHHVLLNPLRLFWAMIKMGELYHEQKYGNWLQWIKCVHYENLAMLTIKILIQTFLITPSLLKIDFRNVSRGISNMITHSRFEKITTNFLQELFNDPEKWV